MYSKFAAITLAILLAGPAHSESIKTNTNTVQDKPVVYGLIEKVVFLPDHLPFNAKMDTGAQTSSLDAHDIERFQKDGDDWVRFDLVSEDENNNQRTVTYEREVARVVKLKGAGGKDKRPAVLMKVCIGNHIYEEQFTLRDRSDMKYPVLIGQKTIEHLGLIDVNQQFTIEPKCQE